MHGSRFEGCGRCGCYGGGENCLSQLKMFRYRVMDFIIFISYFFFLGQIARDDGSICHGIEIKVAINTK